ncbi:MAG: glycosyltransferase family 4 protein [Burkholderiaceae bacterium]
MNILLINHYAGSPKHGMEFRPYYLAREWVRSGHAVTIVAASFSHVRQCHPEVQSAVVHETIDGISYRWLPTPAYAGNGLRRALNIGSFLRQVWCDAKVLVADVKPDVVIASSTYPMDIWVARYIARLAGARLVFEVHDLWPASPIELSGMSPWHPFIMLCQKAENDAYRDADLVVSMLPCVAEHMRAHGLDLKKLHIVPNGIAPDDWQAEPVPLDPRLLEHLRAQQAAGLTIVGYAGSHGLPNALDVLLDAAARLRNEPFAFVLVGDGMEKPRLVQRVGEQQLDNVRLFAPIPKAQVPALLREMTIAYIGWQRQAIYRFGIAPNKLLDYMMAGVPVLHSVQAGNNPVAEADCGLTVEPESVDAVVHGLRRLAAVPAAERRAMGVRGRAFVSVHHSYPMLAQRFLEAIA